MVRTNERYAEYQADGDQVDGPKAVQEAMVGGGGGGSTVDQTARDAAAAASVVANSKYTKPGSGIPESDLSAALAVKVNAGAQAASAILRVAGRTTGIPIGISMPTTRAGAYKGNTLWHQALWLPDGVDAVRIALLSDVADVSTYLGVKVAAQTTNASSLGVPSGGATFTPVTFAGGGASPTFSAGSIEDPVPVWSDWVPVRYLGQGIDYLLVRAWYPGGVAPGGGYFNQSALGGRAAKLNDLGIATANKFKGSGVNVTEDLAAPLTDTNVCLPIWVQARYRRPVPSVWLFGDSTRQGWYADGVVSAIERIAIAASLAGRPMSASNFGYTDQTSQQYLARLRRLVASGFKCDVLVWQIASPNDVSGGITSAQQIAAAVEALQVAQDMGAKFVADGPLPFTSNAPSATQLEMVTGAKDWGLSVASSGAGAISYADYSELHDAGTFGKWSAQYNYNGDGLHPNESAVSQKLVPALASALSRVGVAT